MCPPVAAPAPADARHRERLDAWLPVAEAATRLRRFRPGDAERFHAYRSDPGLARYQGWSPMDRAQARAFVTEMAGVTALRPGDWIQLAIALVPSDDLIGDVGLYLDPDGTGAEVGFTLDHAAQGQGHAARALAAAVALVGATTGARTLRAVTDERNHPSVRTIERAGFGLSLCRPAVFKGEDCIERVYVLGLPRGGPCVGDRGA